MNILEERNTRLAEMDHGPLLGAVGAALELLVPTDLRYLPAARTLHLDADAIAVRCVERARRGRLADPVRPGSGFEQVVTLNMGQAAREELRASVRRLQELVERYLAQVAELHGLDFEGLATSLAHSLLDNQRDRKALKDDAHLLHHELTGSIDVYRQLLSLEKDGEGGARTKVFRWHKLTIRVDQSDFEEQMRAALARTTEEWTDDEDEREDLAVALARMLEKPSPNLVTLKRVVDTQTIGQIKKEAQIRYLEYLAGAFPSGHPVGSLVADLARRLRLIKAYVQDPMRAEGDYECSYQNQPYNLRSLLAAADVFDALPIIPKVEGHLGEVTGLVRRERIYTFGMRLKLNGAVQDVGRPTSFQYHLAQIAPDLPSVRNDRRLVLLFLYRVVFDRFGDRAYDPLAAFEQQVLPVLRGADEAAKEDLLRTTVHTLQHDAGLAQQLATMAGGLREKLRRGHLPPSAVYPLHIAVQKGVLDPTAGDRGADPFFREHLFKPSYRLLPYIAVTDAAVAPSALYKLTGELRFDTMSAYEVPDGRHNFSMAYLQKGPEGCAALRELPIVLAPAGDPGVAEEYLAASSALIVFTRPASAAPPPSAADAFVYRYAHAVVTWVCIHTLLRHLPSQGIFVPVVRFHQTPEPESSADDQFVAGLGKVLAHLIGQERLTSSQGFSLVNPFDRSFRLRNARSSLYAPLPKTFTGALPGGDDGATLPRCAILVVSSRASDDVRQEEEDRVLTIVGESIGLVQQKDNTVRIRRLRTFTGTYPARQAFSRPMAVLDEVQRLYARGYRHLLYVAQAPYTSSLHMTDAEDDEHLFFMSRTILQGIKDDRADLTVYPVFFGKYPAVEYWGERRVSAAQARSGRSLYVQDTRELLSLVRDPSKQIAVFLNLFTGKTLRSLGETLYNEVISYATLLNVYTDIQDDAAIAEGLIADRDGTNALKNALILYLTLLHFARYEVDQGEVVLKLDPYTGIIGSDSVGKHATFPHWKPTRQFNLLAFLHEVGQILAATDRR